MATRMKVQKTKNDQYVITIPKALVELLNIQKGTIIEFKIKDIDEIILKLKNEKKG